MPRRKRASHYGWTDLLTDVYCNIIKSFPLALGARTLVWQAVAAAVVASTLLPPPTTEAR